MGKTFTLETPSKGIDTYFICSDVHTEKIHMPTFKIMLEMARDMSKKPNLIINGDLLDVDWLFKKNEAFNDFKKRANGIEDYFIPSFEEEMSWGNWFFDSIKPYFKEITYVFGNHDERIPWFAESKDCPVAYKDYFSINKSLSLDKRRVKTIRYNDWLDIGELSLTHGMYHGPSAQKKHYEASSGRSVIYGHVHKFQVTPFTARGKTKQVWSLPCVSDMNPDYVRNSENDWSHGFMVVNMRHNGLFNAHTVQVWEDEYTDYTGRVFKGKIPLENW